MTRYGVSPIRRLFQAEEVTWRRNPGLAPGGRACALSLKAVFWCAAAIGISLVLGNLV